MYLLRSPHESIQFNSILSPLGISRSTEDAMLVRSFVASLSCTHPYILCSSVSLVWRCCALLWCDMVLLLLLVPKIPSRTYSTIVWNTPEMASLSLSRWNFGSLEPTTPRIRCVKWCDVIPSGRVTYEILEVACCARQLGRCSRGSVRWEDALLALVIIPGEKIGSIPLTCRDTPTTNLSMVYTELHIRRMRNPWHPLSRQQLPVVNVSAQLLSIPNH